MLTRLKVSGFKNLVNVDVRFGAFTCIAGANGVGKSNLFDAIMFLSALADKPLLDAANTVRSEGGRVGDLRGLFQHTGDYYAPSMSFEAEMIVPDKGVDDLGQPAEATSTFLRYRLELKYRQQNGFQSLGSLEIIHESLTHITQEDAPQNLLFPHKKQWRESVVKSLQRGAPFLSTAIEPVSQKQQVQLHQDGGSTGKPRPFVAATLPRTVLSTANAAEAPTALLARREMQSWRLLQLEPSELRKPDDFTAPAHMETNGTHLPSTLYRLANSPGADPAQVYTQIANRLAELIEDVREVNIDRDDKRQLLTLQLTARDKTAHAAQSLSDGTLRFLALAILERDYEASGLICLEEPENGIHPARIPAMLELLQDIAMDVDESVGEDNPLRQVIINTHSPGIVQQVPQDSLLVAELLDSVGEGGHYKRVEFAGLSETWRAKLKTENEVPARTVSLGVLLDYLGMAVSAEPPDSKVTTVTARPVRVKDRPDIQALHKQMELPL